MRHKAIERRPVLTCTIPHERFDCVLGAVAHDEFVTIDPMTLLNEDGFVYDAKRIWFDEPMVRFVDDDERVVSAA